MQHCKILGLRDYSKNSAIVNICVMISLKKEKKEEREEGRDRQKEGGRKEGQMKETVMLELSYPDPQSIPNRPEVAYKTGGVYPLQHVVLCRLALLLCPMFPKYF